MQTLEKKAAALTARPYILAIDTEELPDGQQTYVASNPELLGCLGQGSTQRTAVANLASARYEYMLTHLRKGWAIPETETTGRDGTTIHLRWPA